MKKIYYIEENLGDRTRVYYKCSTDPEALACEYIDNFGRLMYRDGNEIRYHKNNLLAATIRELFVID